VERLSGIYVRISDDREGAGLGVERQEKDCREVAARLGWHVAQVYVDNDLTAYAKSSRAKVRPGYQALKADLENGTIRGVIAWHTDRLHRNPRELEDFIDVCEAHDVRVETVKSGIVDLRTPAGQAVARTLCAWAYYESAHKSERVRAKYVQLAEQGQPGNGGYRPFGYTKDRRALVPEEAEELRRVYAQLLAGRGMRALCTELTDRGFTTTQGAPWSLQALRYNLLSPRNAGLREHRRQIVGPAVWPAIVDRETWEKACAILRAPHRLQPTNNNARRYLLTGFLFCGRCGTKLTPRATDAKGRRRYGCPPASAGGCGGSSVHADTVHDLIRDLVLARLERDAELNDVPNDPTGELLDRIAADEQRLTALAEAYADDDEAEPLELRLASARIRKRIAATRAELAQVTVQAARPAAVSRAAWELDYDLQQRRQVVASLIERIDVGPGRPGRFDPARLRITWV
jgi:DNA invertase Pin-like site-specific DNA recombinase